MARRIVSLVASNTEIVCALGLADRLVGLDNFSDHPVEVQHLPRVGRDLEIDAARVAALEPDLVLASLSVPGMERNLPALARANLPLVTIRTNGWEGLWDNIRQVAAVCGVPERAEVLTSELRGRVRRLAERVADTTERPAVYWEWWPKPPITAGGSSWISEMCRLAGGKNCFGDLESESEPVKLEQVRERDPAVIILCWCGARRLPDPRLVADRPGWSDLPAIRQNRLHAVLEPHFGRPGPRLVDGLEELASLLHPDLA